MKKTIESKYNLGHVETIKEYVNAHLNRQEIGELIDALYWEHKVILMKTVKLINQDMEKEFQS